MNTLRLSSIVLALAAFFSPLALGQCELAKLLADDGAAGDRLGHSVALWGDAALVGAPLHDTPDPNCGSAYVFRYDGLHWVEMDMLWAFDVGPYDNDEFGHAVALFGDTAIVGAPHADGYCLRSGVAYVFRFDGSSWVPEERLAAPNCTMNDHFGYSVAISGDVAVVGAPYADVPPNSGGVAYVFRRAPDPGDPNVWVWSEEAQLSIITGQAGDQFGRSVAISGSTIVVGAPGRDTPGFDCGAAYVFRYDGGGWVESPLVAPVAFPYDEFGFSVGISGDVTLVGVPGDDENGDGAGATYVYRYDGSSGQWLVEDKLLANDGSGGDDLGSAVALWGGTAVIGAPGADPPEGAAYLYRFDGSGWVEEDKLQHCDPFASPDGELGTSVAVFGDTAVAGAPEDDDLGIDSGAAYVFSLSIRDTEKVVPSTGAGSSDQFGTAVAACGATAVVGADWHSNDPNNINTGIAYVFRYDGSSWVQEAELWDPNVVAQDHFGRTTAAFGDVALIGAYGRNNYAGAAYVFRFDGWGWVLEQELSDPNGHAHAHFGSGLAVFGDAALVGAWHDNTYGTWSGSAFAFRYDGAEWVYMQEIVSSDIAAQDSFGGSIALSGDVAVIGAAGHENDPNDNSSGAAYVFRQGPHPSDPNVPWVWIEEAKLTASDGAPFDQFGGSVDISGDVAVVGATGHGDHSGAAYVFRYDGSSWIEEAKLVASDGAAWDFFGESVAVSGDLIVVGAFGDDPDEPQDPNDIDRGSAYVFHYDGSQWVGQAKLLAEDGAAEDEFGQAVALSGETALIGAPLRDEAEYNSGAAYIFDVGRYCPGDMNCDGSLNGLDIEPFILALMSTPPDYLEYYGQYPDCDVMLGDCNSDGSINGLDIDPLVAILTGG